MQARDCLCVYSEIPSSMPPIHDQVTMAPCTYELLELRPNITGIIWLVGKRQQCSPEDKSSCAWGLGTTLHISSHTSHMISHTSHMTSHKVT